MSVYVCFSERGAAFVLVCYKEVWRISPAVSVKEVWPLCLSGFSEGGEALVLSV